MPTESQYEQELEAQEKKHRRWMKYDLETLVVLVIIAGFIVAVNLILRTDYRSIGKVKSALAPTMNQCNKSIMDVAETFRKNSVDSASRARVEGAKISFDIAITDYNKLLNNRANDGVIVSELDTCYLAAVNFRVALGAKKTLNVNEISTDMLDAMDKDISHLGTMIDSLTAGVDSYNASGFFLTFSWITPFPGKLQYQHLKLPELQPYPDI